MKKILTMILTLGWLVSFGQTVDSLQLKVGNIDYTGFSKVSKGAFWIKRPEAKIVYYGGKPDGINVYNLPADFFVLFAKGEHNPLDINYIVFPKGEKVYEKEGIFYAAICGNMIASMIRVEGVSFIKESTKNPLDNPLSFKEPISFSAASVLKTITPGEPAPKVKQKPTKTKFFQKDGVKIGCWVIGVGGLVASVWCLIDSQHKPDSKPVTPPVPPVTDTGGPGGAPVTTGSGPGGSGTTGG